MAFQDFVVLYKIYPFGTLSNRSNAIVINSWASVDFNLGRDCRLVKTVSMLEAQPGVLNGAVDGNLSGDINLKYSWRGDLLDSSRNFIKGTTVKFFDDPFPGERTFQVPWGRLHGSSDNEQIDYPCTFCGGFYLERISVTWNNAYNLPDPYWGRLYLKFTFEI